MPPLPRRILFLLAALVLGFAPAPLPRRQRDNSDFSTFQGRWRMTRQEYNGNPTAHNFEFVMKGSQWSYFRLENNNKAPGPVYHIVLDRGVQPFLIEWKTSPQAATSWVGSYRIKGRTLEFIYVSGNNVATRPTDFEARVGHRMVYEYVGRD